MVHAKAAITPSSRKVMEETSPSVLEYTSLVNVHDEDESVLTKSRTKTHRRHSSLFSHASAPFDLSDYPSMRRTPSSKTATVLQKSNSGNSNWKLGEFFSKFRGTSTVKENARSTTLTTDTASEASQSGDPKTVEKEANTETSGNKIDEISVRKLPSSQKEWKKGKDHATLLDETASPTDTSTSKSLHFTSLSLFSSSKFSSSGDLDVSASPLERSGQLESSEQTPNQLSSKWTDIQGANNWKNLMDPLDLDLRKEILRYGDFAQLAYDNFECNAHSKYAGSARHSKQKLFQKLQKQDCGYEVTRYLYATSDNLLPGVLQSSLASETWDTDSNWMGYVAVANDIDEIERLGRRDIVVAWRGAAKTIDWLVDAQTQMAPIRVSGEDSKVTEPLQRPKVEKEFWSLYTCKRRASQFNRKSASEQVITELRRLLTLYKGDNLSITLTGHNLGGALAVLTAYEIAERGLNKLVSKDATTAIPVTAFTFGAPHVGDGVFRRRFEELKLKVLRVVNVHDVVPKSIANFYPLWGSSDASKHIGVELQLNHKLSPYLKSSRDPMDWHNLECYLHHVDGYQGPKAKSFELVTRRDPALVNKYADVLQERFCIPAHWWQAENKGLALSLEGRWVEPDRAPKDTPSLANRERFV